MRKAFRYAVLVFIFALPFGTKKFITALIPQLYEYAREFSSLIIYLTDIVALAFVIAVIVYGGGRVWQSRLRNWYAALAALSFISIFFSLNSAYSLYVAVGFVLALAASLAVAFVIREGLVSVRALFAALAASAFFQAVIAVVQFYYQKSAGLMMLGETVATSTTPGIARVGIDGVRYLRAYGTLPHANILAGFLVMGLIAAAYLFLTASPHSRATRIGSAVSLFIILAALILTFSRSGWIVSALSLCSVCVYAFWKKELRPRAYEFFAVALISLAALLSIFGWAVISRAGFATGEASVNHRIYYNEIGLTLIREHPFGVGIGNEVLQAAQEGLFAAKGLTQVWLWQPVHNIYILIADELGIAGLAVFLLMLFMTFRRVRFTSPDAVFAGMLVISLLLFGFVDHFPWDLHAGRFMFWTAFGIMGAVL